MTVGSSTASAPRPASVAGPAGTGAPLSLVDLALSPRVGGEVRRLGTNDVALDPARDAGSVLLVRDGSLRVYALLPDGRERLAQIIGAGHWTGVEALAGSNPSRTRVKAAEESLVVVVDAGRLIAAAVAEPAVGRELIRQLARLAMSLTHQLTEVTLLDCESRLVHALLRLSRTGGGERDGSRVTLRLTQQDLADALGIARETVNGMLQRLAQLQLVTKRRGRISFDLVQLEQWVTHLDAAGGQNQ